MPFRREAAFEAVITKSRAMQQLGGPGQNWDAVLISSHPFLLCGDISDLQASTRDANTIS